MILTERNLANDHLRIYANLNGFKVGDEIENVGYSSFISKEVELFGKETGLRDVPQLFSKWLKNKYKDFLYEG